MYTNFQSCSNIQNTEKQNIFVQVLKVGYTHIQNQTTSTFLKEESLKNQTIANTLPNSFQKSFSDEWALNTGPHKTDIYGSSQA